MQEVCLAGSYLCVDPQLLSSHAQNIMYEWQAETKRLSTGNMLSAQGFLFSQLVNIFLLSEQTSMSQMFGCSRVGHCYKLQAKDENNKDENN